MRLEKKSATNTPDLTGQEEIIKIKDSFTVFITIINCDIKYFILGIFSQIAFCCFQE